MIDLDGTLYRGSEAIPGASDFIAELTRREIAYLFVTNRANRLPREVADQLTSMGIPAAPEEVLTSAQATAAYIGPCRAFCIGENGLIDTLESAGIEVVEDRPDVVVVSYDRGLTYDRLTKAHRHLMAGARFVATNPDPYITLEDGMAPETGANVAALQSASGKTAEIVGKPQPAIVEAALFRLGLPPESCIVLGDNVHTDILAAHGLKMRSALILTGVSSRSDAEKAGISPTWIAEDYPDLMSQLFT
ncbi:MAG: HAD-IIA family hydrolase [Kiloniellales bacterium]|nr:HAD-IIA family hydrolase [Kiloniellales bacterium]